MRSCVPDWVCEWSCERLQDPDGEAEPSAGTESEREAQRPGGEHTAQREPRVRVTGSEGSDE